MSDTKISEAVIIETLLQLAFAAWCVAGDGEEMPDGSVCVAKANYESLASHLDTLDKLPDQPGYVCEATAKARWALRGLLHPQPAELAELQGVNGWDIAEKVRADLDRQSCPDAYMRIAVESVVKHLAATGKQQVGEVVTDEMVEAALQSTVTICGKTWRELYPAEDQVECFEDMRKAIQVAISAQPHTPNFTPATQAVPDNCDRIYWRHSYYTLPLGPSDRAKPTRRRQSAVELVQKLGFQWKDEEWKVAARQPGAQEVEFRDREADRRRFSDPKFNAYLDQAITENGEFTTWHQLTNTTDAYYGYQAGLHDGAPDPFGAQGIDLGQLKAVHSSLVESLAKIVQVGSLTDEDFARDLVVRDRYLPHLGNAVAAVKKLWSLIDQRDAAPGVGNGD